MGRGQERRSQLTATSRRGAVVSRGGGGGGRLIIGEGGSFGRNAATWGVDGKRVGDRKCEDKPIMKQA